MKNSRIVRAYDSINPSTAEKERMLNAILQEAHLEEKPVRQRKKKDPIVYTARPTKVSKRSTFMTIAASILMLLISGMVLAHMIGGRDQNPSYVEPTEKQVNVTVNVSYVPVLEKYRTALREGWSKEECEIEGISTRFYMPEPVDFTIGKRMLDINHDGKAELLIGHDDIIWELYTTLEDGTPIQLLSDVQDGWQYYLNQDGLIAAEHFSKEDCYAEYYRLEGHQLVMELQLEYSDGQWKQQKAGQEWEVIIADSAEETINSFERFTPDWVPLLDHEQIDTDALERYTLILEKYKTALAENWTEEKCEENDISTQLVNGTVISNNLGWCMTDIDGNSTNELIISDGERIYDLYTLSDEGVPEHILMATGTNVFNLCQNAILQEQVFFSKGCSWYFHQLSNGKQELEYIVTYRNEYEGTAATEQYYYGTDDNDMQPISKDEAGTYITAYQEMEMSLTLFQKRKADAGECYTQVLEKYRTALREKWDMQLCSDNDISLMISYFVEDPDRIGAHPLDLDGDGTMELIITDGMMIYDLYTLKDGSPVHLITGWERNSYQLCLDNIIYNRGSNGAASSVNNYYQLQNGELVLVESVVFDANKDFDNPWFRSSDGETPEEPLTEEEANAIMDSHPYISILGISLLEME